MNSIHRSQDGTGQSRLCICGTRGGVRPVLRHGCCQPAFEIGRGSTWHSSKD